MGANKDGRIPALHALSDHRAAMGGWTLEANDQTAGDVPFRRSTDRPRDADRDEVPAQKRIDTHDDDLVRRRINTPDVVLDRGRADCANTAAVDESGLESARQDRRTIVPIERTPLSLERELRKDLMNKHMFITFSVSHFDVAARIFRDNGYQSVTSIRNMDARERNSFLQQAKSDTNSKRTILADLRLALKIFARFEPQGRIRAENTPFSEISTDSRMKSWAVDFPGSHADLNRAKRWSIFLVRT